MTGGQGRAENLRLLVRRCSQRLGLTHGGSLPGLLRSLLAAFPAVTPITVTRAALALAALAFVLAFRLRCCAFCGMGRNGLCRYLSTRGHGGAGGQCVSVGFGPAGAGFAIARAAVIATATVAALTTLTTLTTFATAFTATLAATFASRRPILALTVLRVLGNAAGRSERRVGSQIVGSR